MDSELQRRQGHREARGSGLPFRTEFPHEPDLTILLLPRAHERIYLGGAHSERLTGNPSFEQSGSRLEESTSVLPTIRPVKTGSWAVSAIAIFANYPTFHSAMIVFGRHPFTAIF